MYAFSVLLDENTNADCATLISNINLERRPHNWVEAVTGYPPKHISKIMFKTLYERCNAYNANREDNYKKKYAEYYRDNYLYFRNCLTLYLHPHINEYTAGIMIKLYRGLLTGYRSKELKERLSIAVNEIYNRTQCIFIPEEHKLIHNATDYAINLLF